ncbi:MAG: multicopper oxidase family protein [Bauldia sp.]|nr:multicopper oxidase family protein [Bauldia sp.]
MLTRRRLMTGTAALGGAGLLAALAGRAPVYGQSLGAPAEPVTGVTIPLDLVAAERPTALPCFAGHTLPMWTLSDETWLPIVRMPFGAALEVSLENRLPREGEHASIHWHGIRLPNDQDGVPYLVQPPVLPGDRYAYRFTPPDTGTFFFHTHCNTAEHLGRGLHGVLIVEGDETEPYDADEVLLLRDWRIDAALGQFLAFTTNRGAGRAGTYGPVRSVNGIVGPTIDLPASGDCRLRLINVDPTRILTLGIEGADAAIVAVDGVAIAPIALFRWELGPAMRIDIVIRSPADGGTAQLVDYRIDPPLPLAALRGVGAPVRTGGFDPAPLRAGHVPEPDLSKALPWELRFDASGDADIAVVDDPALPYLGPLCLTLNDFWTINEAGWPSADHARLPAPLAELTRGATYAVTLRNPSRFHHPIHIHGHTLKVLASDKQTIVPHFADTVLLLPEETIQAAFVADNPGKWMIHCHVAEHQETGMMGYYTVG